MCQNQGQTIYTRNARTRTVAIKLNMPNPFFALALGLCTQANSRQGEMGAGTTSFHFKRLYRPRSRGGRSRHLTALVPTINRVFHGRYTQLLAGTGPRDVYPGPRGTGTPPDPDPLGRTTGPDPRRLLTPKMTLDQNRRFLKSNVSGSI
jgi:hypothetical protein